LAAGINVGERLRPCFLKCFEVIFGRGERGLSFGD